MLLKTNNISLSFPEDSTRIFSDLSFGLQENETGLLTGGPGTGKTVLGLALCGFLPLWAGSWDLAGDIELFGRKLVQGATPADVGIILENPYSQLSGMKRTVRHELAFPLESRGVDRKTIHARVDQFAVSLGIGNLLDRNIRTLSGGELQRTLIAETLITEPRFLFLDRPMTEIDQEFRATIMSLVKENVVKSQGAALFAEDRWNLPDTGFDVTVDLEEENGNASSEMTCDVIDCDQHMTDETVLEIDSLSFAYDGVSLIDDFSLNLRRGEVLFLSGRNGAGKTTLAKLITGVLAPKAGSIVINGNSAAELKEWDRFSRVGYSVQEPGYLLCRRSVREEIELAEKWGNPVDRFIDVLGLDELYDRHPQELTQAEKKRLGLALSCGGKRDILILDEPSQYQNMDGLNRIARVIARCAEEGSGVIIITHDPRLHEIFPTSRNMSL